MFWITFSWLVFLSYSPDPSPSGRVVSMIHMEAQGLPFSLLTVPRSLHHQVFSQCPLCVGTTWTYPPGVCNRASINHPGFCPWVVLHISAGQLLATAGSHPIPISVHHTQALLILGIWNDRIGVITLNYCLASCVFYCAYCEPSSLPRM